MSRTLQAFPAFGRDNKLNSQDTGFAEPAFAASLADSAIVDDDMPTDLESEPRFLEQFKMFYEDAAPKTGIDQDHLDLIESCQAVIRFNVPLRRDDGSLESITCYR